jgi:hypothetical protein
MAHSIHKYQLSPFWNDEYLHLDYNREPFNDPMQSEQWQQLGLSNQFTGEMCDMRHPQPSWNPRVIDIFAGLGWKDIGTSYYRMNFGTVLPTHSDTYVKYIDLYQLAGQEHSIRRAVIFLQDWQPGHYAEYMDQPFVKWKAGATVEWSYDTPHMAANLGTTPRYTLQITGHL